MPDAFLISIGAVNVIGSTLCALHIFRSKAGEAYRYWGWMHLSYALMPFFGLGDDLIGLQDDSRLDFVMGGFSLFFSLMTLVFYLFAVLIENRNIRSGRTTQIALGTTTLLLLGLYQAPALFEVSRQVFRLGLLPAGLLAFWLFGRVLHARGHLLAWPGAVMIVSLGFSLAGFLSLLLIAGDNPWRGYGWYAFSWIGVAGLWLAWHLSRRPGLRD